VKSLLLEFHSNNCTVPLAKTKILLVDDLDANLMVMTAVLESDQYILREATSGNKALDILENDPGFSLILLDVNMPVMDGYETARIIQSRPHLRDIPIIFITAGDYEVDAVFRGYQTGAVDYIGKPFKPQVLRAKVSVFAELHKKNQLLKHQEEKLRQINMDLVQLNQELESRVQDRTNELKQLNDQLKELNNSKDKFISVISHDLRNPLTALIASSRKLHQEYAMTSPEEIRKLSDIIYRTSRRVLIQLNDVVDWARQQQDKFTFNPVCIELEKEMDEWLDLLKDNAAQKNIEVQNRIPEGICVRADFHMLRSVVQNIVTNAIKYTPEGGYVRLTATPVHSMVEICVEDTGIGMSAEDRQDLFDRPSSRSGTNNETGSGLGLLLVKDFVAQHGGSIQVESDPGKGTHFKFTVPLDRI
jgi:two-component system, sensor histidine kinase and response regulator